MDEIQFGQALGELSNSGIIKSPGTCSDFVSTVESMRRLLNVYYWDDNSEDALTCDDSLLVTWESIKSNEQVGITDALEFVSYVEDLITDLNEGDYDDAFGPSGYSEMVFN